MVKFNQQYSPKVIFQISFPVLISMLMQNLIGMADTAFLGRLGEVELGASALGSVYYLAFFMIGLGFSLGVQILVGRYNGREEYSSIGQLFYSGSWFLLGMALLMIGCSLGLGRVCLRPFIESEDIFNVTMEYLDWRIWGLGFVFLQVLFRAFYSGILQTRILMINSVVMVLVNVLLNYLLIFGKWGFPAWGIAGAAAASVLSELVALLFLLGYFWIYTDFRKYGFRVRKWFDWNVLREVLKLSVWTMVQYFVMIFVWFFFFIAVEHLGEEPLAIINVARNISGIPFLVLNAFAVTGCSMVSNLIGAGGKQLVFRLGWRVCRVGGIALLPVLLFMVFCPEWLIQIFTDNQSLITASVPVIYVVTAASALQLFGTVWCEVLLGTGSTREELVVEIITLVVYILAIWYLIFYLRCSPAMAWSVEIVYQVVRWSLAMWFMKFGKWRSRHL